MAADRDALPPNAQTLAEWLAMAEDCLATAHKANSAGLRDVAYDKFGYAVEAYCKAVIMQVRGYDRWPTRDEAAECYTHSIPGLLKAAGLFQRLGEDRGSNRGLRASWLMVKDWQPYRYRTDKPSQKLMMDFEKAVTHERDGILAWLRNCLS
jgi:hypothetical protein